MMWKGVLILAGCGLATAVHAEDATSQATPPLDLPALEQPSSKNTLPEKITLPNNNSVVLPDAAPGRPRAVNTGTAKDNDKDWLVNGLLAWQKKQTEEQNALKQKQKEATELWYQQEMERQQKKLTGAISANPLESSKLTLTGSNSGTAAPTDFTRQLNNLPPGRLSLSGSNSAQNITVNLSGLPELTQTGNNPSREAGGSVNPINSGYNPLQSSNNSLPSFGSQNQWTGNSSAALQKNSPAAVGPLTTPAVNLAPQAPTAYPLTQQPASPALASPHPPASGPAQNGNPFTSAQAANLLKQLDNSKNYNTNPSRPSIKDLHNGIPNPADMRRF